MRPHRPGPQGAALAVADHGGLEGVLLRLPEMNPRRPGRWARGRRTWVWVPSMRSSTPLAAASATTSAKVRSRAAAAWAGRARPSRGRPAAGGSGRGAGAGARSTPSSTARAWSGSCGRSTIRLRLHPVAQHQPLVGPAPAARRRGCRGGGPAWPGAGRSRVGQLGDELAQVLPGDAGEARLGYGRTHPGWSSHPGIIVRPCSCPHDPAINPRLAHHVGP